MRLPLYQIDAFAGRVFGGNPAAVVPLDAWLPDATLQAIATENNLSETAFFVAEEGARRLRWFTPVAEVDLCGHATLAAGYVCFRHLGDEGDTVLFHTRSGALRVEREGDLLALDFPALVPEPLPALPALDAALGVAPSALFGAMDLMAVLESEADVAALAPDMEKLKALPRRGLIVTARGSEVDFVSRFFAPALGVPEDPVTGSAHCTLTPYWAGKLGKTRLSARQISARGGELTCELKSERVRIAGRAAQYLAGEITIPG